MRNFILFITIVGVVGFISCSKKNEDTQTSQSMTQEQPEPKVKRPLTSAEIQEKISAVRSLPAEPVAADEVAVIETSMGRIVFKFFPDVAPNHCANFKKLANFGFYDGTTFHRVIPGFMIQGGDILSADADPSNDGTGMPGYQIKAEFSDISHRRGIVSMARKPTGPHTAGSQFFICVADAPWLDGQYSVFGEVIEGMDVVDKIVSVPRDERDRPLEDVVVYRIRVIKQEELM